MNTQSKIKMIIYHEHHVREEESVQGSLLLFGIRVFWGSIIKRHYIFAKFLCSVGGLGVH